MNRHIIRAAEILLLLIGTASAVVSAIGALEGRSSSMGLPPGPLPAEVEVCKDKDEGAKVEITTPRGEKMKATCEKIDGQPVAAPESGLRGPRVQPLGGPQNG
ncbi:MAG TPA: hypothetical protein DCP92_07255 [Nitrospiraceae bacterium]|nr:hypothetical protein [Nitrospiraceae bacterium]